MEAAYVSVYLWKNTVEKAKSFDVKAIQDNAGGVTFDAPEGLVTLDGESGPGRVERAVPTVASAQAQITPGKERATASDPDPDSEKVGAST